MNRDVAQATSGVDNIEAGNAEVRRMDDESFSILLERIKVDECWDQSREIQMGQGCVSTPGSPGC